MKDGWIRLDEGIYSRREGLGHALVCLEGELWCTRVYWNGKEVDRGEWDGRGTAFRNAWAAVRRARELRNPLVFAGRVDEDDEDTGDPPQ